MKIVTMKQKIKIVPGLLFEPVGSTKFKTEYLNITLDLKSTTSIYNNMLNVKEEELSLQHMLIENKMTKTDVKTNKRITSRAAIQMRHTHTHYSTHIPKMSNLNLLRWRNLSTTLRIPRATNICINPSSSQLIIIKHCYMLLSELDNLLRIHRFCQ